MNWLYSILDTLSKQPEIGYLPGAAVAAEPTAIAALALAAHGRTNSARKAVAALAEMQGASGAVGIRTGEDAPGWATSLAVSAWCAVGNALRGIPALGGGSPNANDTPAPEWHRGHSLQRSEFGANIDRGVAWLLANRGEVIARTPEFGHNTQLVGWAYAEQTHSWVEPTALAVLALRAAGKSSDPAAREGVAVLLDRQLPGGGLNYGNTYVLGQLIRPHVQPTGIALVALAGEQDSSGRLAKSAAWLRRAINPETTPQSLAWALLGLRAQNALPSQADEWLSKVAGSLREPSLGTDGSLASDGTRSVPATFKLALLALAAKGWPK